MNFLRKSLFFAGIFTATTLSAEEIGSVDTVFKLLGPDHKIVIDAFDDPQVEGVTCYVSRAKTGGITGGLGLAEDTSDASIECQQTGPIKFKSELEDGDEVFGQRTSILFKRLQVVRFFDEKRNTLVYLTYSDKLIEGSPKKRHLGGNDTHLGRVTLYTFETPVRFVGGGFIDGLDDRFPIIAADGGADAVLAAGLFPHAVIGDFDSLENIQALENKGISTHKITEQQSTDFEKCLYSVDAPLVIADGFLGKRIDHSLAALTALIRHSNRRIILKGEGEIAFFWREIELDMTKGDRISFFPMDATHGGGSQGLVWPTDGLDFAPWAAIGTSNAARGGSVSAQFTPQTMVAILPIIYLEQIVSKFLNHQTPVHS